MLKGGDCFSGNSREQSYIRFFFFPHPCRPLEWGGGGEVAMGTSEKKPALNSHTLKILRVVEGHHIRMREGTISGNAACVWLSFICPNRSVYSGQKRKWGGKGGGGWGGHRRRSEGGHQSSLRGGAEATAGH